MNIAQGASDALTASACGDGVTCVRSGRLVQIVDVGEGRDITARTKHSVRAASDVF